MVKSAPLPGSIEEGDAPASANPGATLPIPGWEQLAGLDPASATFPVRARVEGDTIVVFKSSKGFHGVQRSCPHQNASFLLTGELAMNETMLRCSLHAFTFRLSDGKGINCPGFRLKVYEIKEESGVLFARRRP